MRSAHRNRKKGTLITAQQNRRSENMSLPPCHSEATLMSLQSGLRTKSRSHHYYRD